MEVTEILVMINGPGVDRVCVGTDLPSPMPHITEEPLLMTFDVECRKGIGYAKTHFPGKPVFSLDLKTGQKEQVR